jgi:AraC-like DNA-binding protein
MSRDTLSDVLRSVRMRSAVYFLVSGEGSWAADTPASRDIAAAVMPGAEHVMEYHVVTAGQCWAVVAGEPPCRLRSGDIVLLPQGDAHVITSDPSLRGVPDPRSFFELQRDRRPFRMSYANATRPTFPAGDDDRPAHANSFPATSLVCGFIAVDSRPFNPLLAALPRLLHLPADRAGHWSGVLAQLAAAESADRRPGSEAVLERLSEMMFVDALRRHIDSMSDNASGWLAGLRDRFVGRALALLHERPAEDWTIDALGSQVGLSRSALHQRFVDLIGQPPMQYLAQWRMQLASQLLRDTQSSIAAIALEVGYDSEAAFVRAFKRLAGSPPATWRRDQLRFASMSAPALPTA